MGVLKQLFTWWDGAGLTTLFHVRRHGRQVGTDDQGNLYYAARQGDRRWVIYNGPNDASRIPPDWHSWLHHQIDGLPDEALPPPPKFLRDPSPNLTGTASAYRPSGALERGGRRPAASGDYQAWTPDQG
jgi:NADH:ubiquinone oxidoreductase subunit